MPDQVGAWPAARAPLWTRCPRSHGISHQVPFSLSPSRNDVIEFGQEVHTHKIAFIAVREALLRPSALRDMLPRVSR